MNDMLTIMNQVSDVYKNMSNDQERYTLLETLGGRQQAAVAAALIQNIDTINKAYNTAMNSMGSATKEQERLMNSIDAKMNALKENILGMWLDISNSSAIKGLVDNVNELVTSLRNSESVASGFSTAFNGVSTVINAIVNVIGKGVNSVGLLGTVITGMVAKLSLTNTKFKNFADNLTNCIPGIKTLKDGITSLGVKLLSSAENTQEAINAQKQFIAQTNLSKTATAGASLQLVALNAKMALCKVGAIALQGAIVLLNSALTMGLSLAVSAGINAINNLIHAQENLKQSNDDYLSSLKNGDSFNASGAEKALASYKKLSQELSNLVPNTEEYKNKEQELVEVKNQLIALLPEAEQLFTNSAEAKGLDTQATEELIEKEKELAKAKAYDVLDDNNYKDKSSVQKEILEYEALQEQIKLANKLREEGKKTGYANVSKDYNGSGKLATSARDAEVYAERLEQSESKLRAFYEAMNQLDDGSGKFSEEMKMISDTLGIVDETLQNTTDTANNTDLSNIVDQFEEGAESAGNFEEAIKGLQDSFSSLQDGIDLLDTMMEEMREYNDLTPDTMEKVLSSGDANLIALLADSNTLIEKGMQLQSQYRDQKEATKNAIIDQALAEVNGNQQIIDSNNGVCEAYNQQANALNNLSQAMGNIDTGSIGDIIPKGFADSMVDEYANAIGQMTGLNDNLANDMVQALVDYVNQGGQLYAEDLNNLELTNQAKAQTSQMWKNQEIMDLASMITANADNYNTDIVNWANAVNSKSADGMVFEDNVINQVANMVTANAGNYSTDTVNWASAITNKDQNNVQMVNSIIQAIAQMVLLNSQNYSSDTVAWAKAVSSKDTNNATMCTSITEQMAQAINNLCSQYSTDVDNFRNATNEKISMYNSFAGAIRSASQSVGTSLTDALNSANGKTKQTAKELNSLQMGVEAFTKSMKDARQVSGSFSGTQVGGTAVGGKNYSGYVGGNAIPVSGSGGSGGRGASGKGSTGKGASGKGVSGGKGGSGSVGATEKQVADLEDLSKRYEELEKAISKTNNELDIYATLQQSANGQEAVKYIELQIGAYKKLQKQEEELLKAQQSRANELKAQLQSNGFNIDNEGMIANYQSQLDAMRNNANNLSGEAKEKEIARQKELVKLLDEYNELVSKELGNTKKEIADINNQVRDLYRSKLDLVSDAEKNIYDIIEYYAEKQVDAQIEALEKVQDARKKMREDEDYEKDKQKKMEELSSLESQIEILSRDGSRVGQQKLAELKQQYADLMNDLNEVVQDNQDKLFDEMISNETSSLEEQLQEFLNPNNINKIIADGLNSGMVEVLGTQYELNELTQAYLQDTTIGLTNTVTKMSEYVDLLNQAKSAYVNISDSYAQLGIDPSQYNSAQNLNAQIEGSNNAVTNVSYSITLPESITALDREEIENIINPMLEYTKLQTIEEVTKALNGK